MKKKRTKKRSKTYWKRKCDKLWGQLIHQREGCEVGMKAQELGLEGKQYECSGNLEAHHLISRARLNTRHHLENGILLCSLHHKWSTYISPHTAPIAFSEFLKEHYPDKFEWVEDNKYNIKKAPDYEVVFERLKGAL